MVVGFTTHAISAYHHLREFKSHLVDKTLCDQVCQLLATGRWFSLGTLFISLYLFSSGRKIALIYLPLPMLISEKH
jgi:hypothetical protein